MGLFDVSRYGLVRELFPPILFFRPAWNRENENEYYSIRLCRLDLPFGNENCCLRFNGQLLIVYNSLE